MGGQGWSKLKIWKIEKREMVGIEQKAKRG
jgi:hypothetical protein